MSFIDLHLDREIEQGAVGGPNFLTEISMTKSGRELRNQVIEAPYRTWNIGYGIRNQEQIDYLISFFMNRRGRFEGFRFRDWSDYKVEEKTTLVHIPELDAYQTYKRYDDGYGAITPHVLRKITKPVRVTLYDPQGVIVPEDKYTIVLPNGRFRAVPPYVLSEQHSWTGIFDVPVRFDTDFLSITLRNIEAGQVPNIKIKEIVPFSVY